MAWLRGIDFRNTAAFVTDPSGYSPGYTYDIANGGNDYTSAQGYGWESGYPSSYNTPTSTTNSDVRLEGEAGVGDPNQATFRIDLPAPGTYQVQMAIGSINGYSYIMRAELFDDTTSLGVIVNDLTSGSSASGNFTGWDANGTVYDGATLTYQNWITNNPIGGGGSGARNFTFTSTILRLTIGNASGSSHAYVAHLMVTEATTALALAAAGRGMGMARPAGAFGSPVAGRAAASSRAATSPVFEGVAAMTGLALGTATDTMAASAALSATGSGRSGARGLFGTAAQLALAAMGRILSGARGAMSAGAPLAASAAVQMRAEAPLSAVVVLSGRAAAASQGTLGARIPVLSLVARAIARLAGNAQASAAAPLSGTLSAQGRITPGAQFVAPLEARNTLTLTVVNQPQFAAPLAAKATASALARAGAAFRAEMQARSSAAAAGHATMTGAAQLASTARALASATLRAVMTILTPAPPAPPPEINPFLEIDC